MGQEVFAEVLGRLLAEGQGGMGSVNALAKRFVALYGGSRDDYRKQIKRHLADVEPNEQTIGRYADAFGVPRDTFPPEVSPRRAQARAVARLSERFDALEEHVARLQDAVDELLGQPPDPPTNPGNPRSRSHR